MKQSKTKFKCQINVKWGALHSFHSSVRGVPTRYGLDGRGWIPDRSTMFLFFTTSRAILRRRWEDNIRMDLREIGWGGMDWIDLAQDRDQWRVLVNTVMNLRVP
jgi:hypothetical protein